jgi:hypothetical protein
MTNNRNPQLFSLEDIQEIITGKVTKRSRPSHPESRLQCSCVQWFRLQHPDKRLLLFAVPNGGFRIASEAARLYAEGVVPGVSDLIYLEPRGNYGALCIEMKTTLTGSRQSDRQKEWQKAVEAVGIRYVICRTLEEFIKAVEDYLALEPMVPAIGEVEF